MITQGSNTDLYLDFDEDMSDIQDISILLYDTDNNEIKRWTKEDVTINEKQITISLTQEDTINIPHGVVYLEIKWKKDGVVFVSYIQQIWVNERKDKKII